MQGPSAGWGPPEREAEAGPRRRRKGDEVATTRGTEEELEHELQQLIEQETFDPPEEFREHALVTDDSLHREAERDPAGFWLERARELAWFGEPSESLDDSEPPFYRWFA